MEVVFRNQHALKPERHNDKAKEKYPEWS